MNNNPDGMPNSFSSGPMAQPNPRPEPLSTNSPEPIDPMNRPMVQVEQPAPKPKKKVGVIVAMLVCLLLAVGCGVVAALLYLNNNNKDVVALAMKKIMSGENASNVIIDGDIDMIINDPLSPIARAKIDLNTKLVANSIVNATDASITLTKRNSTEDLEFEVNEIYTTDGDVFLKLDGIADAIQALSAPTLEVPVEEDLLTVEDGVTSICEGDDCVQSEVTTSLDIPVFGEFSDMIDLVDGDWIRLSADELGLFSSDQLNSGPLSCVTDLVSDINTNSSSALELYEQNPFVVSSTENMTVTSKKNPIYRITIDDTKLTGFIDAIQNAELLADLYNCLGYEDNVKINNDDVAEAITEMPEIYVEVDSDYNFTRFYARKEIREECTDECQELINSSEIINTIIIDLSFDYPVNINVAEPIEYRDFSEILQEMMMNYLPSNLDI